MNLGDLLGGVFGSGAVITAIVGLVKIWAKSKGKTLSKPVLRWMVYALAAVGAVVTALISKSINFSEPELFVTTIAAVMGSAETVYRLAVGKLGLGSEK